MELALVAPLVVTFFFASIEMARLQMMQHAVHNAAYEAARKGVIPGITAAEVQTHAETYLATVSAQGASISVNPAVITDATETIQISVDLPMDQNSWFSPLFSPGRVLQGECTLKAERYRGPPVAP